MNVAILIPAYNPTEELVQFVKRLVSEELPVILVVNDGSTSECDPIFEKLHDVSRVVLLRHAVNLGKGAALKTGLNYASLNFPGLIGVVTADADGQHLANDVLKVARMLEARPESLVIGSRKLKGKTPFRSKFGNTCTKLLFRLLAGRKLTDTQSGLRGIPMSFIPKLLKIAADGYEFELEMLLACKHANRPVVEQEIETVYIDGNRSSHFNVLLDSLKIYFVLFRFMLASLSTAAVDYVVFWISFKITASILFSLCLARAVAVLVNYMEVKNLVFYSDQKHRVVFPRYLCLVIVNGIIVFVMINYLVASFSLNVIAGKVISELILYLGNFAIQRDFIFSSRTKRDTSGTDWDRYYRKQSWMTAISRKIVSSRLVNLMKRFGTRGATVAELGGANSCFFEAVRKKINPAHYHIIDNNQFGLDLSRNRLISDGQSLSLHNRDVLDLDLPFKVDLAFSVGLIEHFEKENTGRAIRSHFKILEPGGIAIISFPTPTVVYRFTRFLSEMLGLWSFHDERPLERTEVAEVIGDCGTLLHQKTIWAILLTQCIMVAVKDIAEKP